MTSSTSKLFTYGTLMLDDVITTLIGRVPERQKGTARGWRTVRLPDKFYPGLVRTDGGESQGYIYSDLTDEEWLVLDTFEDSAYQLSEILVMPHDVPAYTYIWPGEHESVDWNVEHLSRADLTDYIERCRKWRTWFDAERTKNSDRQATPPATRTTRDDTDEQEG